MAAIASRPFRASVTDSMPACWPSSSFSPSRASGSSSRREPSIAHSSSDGRARDDGHRTPRPSSGRRRAAPRHITERAALVFVRPIPGCTGAPAEAGPLSGDERQVPFVTEAFTSIVTASSLCPSPWRRRSESAAGPCAGRARQCVGVGRNSTAIDPRIAPARSGDTAGEPSSRHSGPPAPPRHPA